MEKSIKAEIQNILTRDNITDSKDSRIEEIADKYPDQYRNDQEYVEFQMEIANLIPGTKLKTQPGRPG